VISGVDIFMPRNRKIKVKIRKHWKINPKTRVKKSQKIYSRKKEKKKIKNEIEGSHGEA